MMCKWRMMQKITCKLFVCLLLTNLVYSFFNVKKMYAVGAITIDDYKQAIILIAKVGGVLSEKDVITDGKFYNFPNTIFPKKWHNKIHKDYFDGSSYFLFKKKGDKTYTGIQFYKLDKNKIEVIAIKHMTNSLSQYCQKLYEEYGYFLVAQDDFYLPERDKKCVNALWRDGIIDNITGDNNIVAEIIYNPRFKRNEVRIIKNEKIR